MLTENVLEDSAKRGISNVEVKMGSSATTAAG
jgi:hypothetical protein